MGESGFSWPEAILTLAVMMLIFGTLLPVSFRMMLHLENKKQEMHAKETLYQGAVQYASYGRLSGEREEEGVIYTWHVEEPGICVSYSADASSRMICIP